MKPIVVLMRSVQLALVISLMGNAGCATPSKQTPTTVGLLCSITWDKTSDRKVTGYQLTVIDQSERAKQVVQSSPQIQRRYPAGTRAPTMKDCGA
jgi:hypothetical protein